MESIDPPAVSSAEASQFLHRRAEVRSWIEQRGPARGYQWLLFWSAVLLSVYVWGVLVGLSGFDPGAPTSGGYTYTSLALLPVLLFSGLVSGARDRFGVRSRASALQAVAYTAAILGFILLGALSLTGVEYPWWLNVLAPAVLFAAMATRPIRQLLNHRPTERAERWRNAPLTVSARWATAGIGVVFGVLAATSTVVWSPIITAATMQATLIAALISWRLPWGLRRTGYQWGPLQWALFAAATVSMFTLAAMIASELVTTVTVVAVVVGAVVCAAMVVAACIPSRVSDG